MNSSTDPRSTLLDRIRDGIRKADFHSSDLKKKNSRYISIGVIASALSTVIAGTAAAVGTVIGQGAAGMEIYLRGSGCLHRHRNCGDRVAETTFHCRETRKGDIMRGKLHSLEFALTVNNRETAEIAKEYEMVIASYPEIIL